MSPQFVGAPLTNDVAGAVSRFFFGGSGPSHTDISRVGSCHSPGLEAKTSCNVLLTQTGTEVVEAPLSRCTARR